MEEINKALHEASERGSDWHQLEEWMIAGEYLNCSKCDATVMEHFENNPDYCSDLNAVAEAEKFVIEKVGDGYARALTDLIQKLFTAEEQKQMNGAQVMTAVFTATAEQRARACLAALQEKQ